MASYAVNVSLNGNSVAVSVNPQAVDDGFYTANQIDSGESTMPRIDVNTSSNAMTSQALRLQYFTARKTFTSTQARVGCGGQAAGATPTLIRIGLYTVDASGNGTLVASTPNDTTLLATQNTVYTKSWSASVNIVKGQRYAFGLLVVTATTVPNVIGYTGGLGGILAESPRIIGIINSQSDLPGSFVAASVGNSSVGIYGEVLP